MGTTELVVAGLLPEIAAALTVSVSSAGLLITVFAVGMMIGAPVMALATLRLPKRSTLIAALLVFAAGHVVVAISTSFEIVLAARFASALATGTFWAVGAVVAAAAAGPNASARAMGVMIGGVTMANVVGVPLGAAGGQALGWQGPFWVLAVLALASTFLIARQVPAQAGGDVSAASLREEFAAIRQVRMWLIYAATALMQGSVLAAYSYVSPLLTERAGLPAAFVPLAMLGYGAGALAGTTYGGRKGDRRPFLVLIPAAGLLAVVLAAITLFATSSAVAVILVVLLGTFGMVASPVLVALVVRTAGTAQALAVSLSTSSFNVGIAGGSWLGGVALASGLQNQGPPLSGLVLALAALLPLTLLAVGYRRRVTGAVVNGHSDDKY
ncbi:MFS transporter [Rhodococcus opacus]|nr:MFS transporter [Rhodococcus opacus]